jgi:hypothetical protein
MIYEYDCVTCLIQLIPGYARIVDMYRSPSISRNDISKVLFSGVTRTSPDVLRYDLFVG